MSGDIDFDQPLEAYLAIRDALGLAAGTRGRLLRSFLDLTRRTTAPGMPRTSSIRSFRDSGSRKPPRIMKNIRIATELIGKGFFRVPAESGVYLEWCIEPHFRDTKDLRFGMGLSAKRISEPTRRDRLLLVNAFAIALLTMLGAAGEALGMDRLLKSNTSKTRTHSLFRQGCMLYERIPTMPKDRLAPVMARFAESVAQCGSFSWLCEVV